MNFAHALTALAVAAAAGGLIGAEREQARADRDGGEFGGVRTFPLLAIAGGLAGLLRPALGPWIVAALLLAVVLALGISQAKARADDVGVTSEVAAIVTFALGVTSTTPELLPDAERYLLVAGVAASTMALLALKRTLHGFIARVSTDDVFATAKFVLLALVVLPLLPDRAFGPFGALNPRKIGWMIALVAGVSFAGYVASRVVGSRRGLLVAGLLGGLVSSTALTVALSSRAKQQAELTRLCGVGIIAASATLFPRVLLIVAVVYPPLARSLALPFGLMAAASYGVALFTFFGSEKADAGAGVDFKNPFELGEALRFGVIYGVVLVVARAAHEYFGGAGIVVSAAVAGLADVDAITLSLADLVRSHAIGAVAAPAIVVAALVNTIVKAVLARVLGGKSLGRAVAPALFATAALGGAVLALEALGVG
ncbi:MAG TPA: DUF4010 domain-containing protein [Polyangiaceae bacterium]|nr:DUF4010 domain-containing protein [Polyangiaceae bacterium]